MFDFNLSNSLSIQVSRIMMTTTIPISSNKSEQTQNKHCMLAGENRKCSILCHSVY